MTADFEVVTVVDQLSEELETFELSLQVPPDTVELGVDVARVVTILDGTHLVNFARSKEVVLEGQELEVELETMGILGYDLTIDIADSTSGFDFAQDISSVTSRGRRRIVCSGGRDCNSVPTDLSDYDQYQVDTAHI